MNIEDWKKAGKIAAEAMKFGKPLVKTGAKLLDVANAVEEKIKELGAQPAFPVNISRNEAAAHYTPSVNDDSVFKEDDLVKLDIGVEYNGAIGDIAETIDLAGRHDDIVKASREALDAAIALIKDGVTLAEIGRAINSAIEARGFKPIRNLSGHELKEYELHAGLSTPNFDNGDVTELREGMVVAIEPFATSGAGMVEDSGNPEIFMLTGLGRVRTDFARNVLKEIQGFNGLPFAKRWLKAKGAAFGLREIKQANSLREYPPLVDANKGLVSQAEHTLLVQKDGCLVLTKTL
ncbi:type II methionyl aminopeptidase [Candidatus Woesearchaeota archaeon]|nr:type II methionyl aminopeptidase [Candidatus Woesearchaeota archaeon]